MRNLLDLHNASLTRKSLASTSQTDNSGPGRAFELLTANVRSWNPKPTISGEEADELLSRRVIELNMWRPLETVEQNP